MSPKIGETLLFFIPEGFKVNCTVYRAIVESALVQWIRAEHSDRKCNREAFCTSHNSLTSLKSAVMEAWALMNVVWSDFRPSINVVLEAGEEIWTCEKIKL